MEGRLNATGVHEVVIQTGFFGGGGRGEERAEKVGDFCCWDGDFEVFDLLG